MLTQCPNCQTTFRVTSEILRVADGQVRCGRCQTQFDALESLIEENDVGDVQSGRFLRPSRAKTPDIEVEEPRTHEDITLEGRRIEITGSYEVLDHSRGEPQVRQEVTEEWVEIEDLDEPGVDAAGIHVVEEFSDDEPLAREEREAALEDATDDLDSDAVAAPDVDLLPTVRRETARAWKWLAAPLAALFVVQIIHHYRSDLARHPTLGPPLAAAYGAVGVTLTPDWNLHAYEIRQWGVVSDPNKPGTLKVRASITNLAGFAQPFPLLKLVLEDRWGDQVRARAFEPAEYLDPGAAPDRLLGSAQKANATIDIVDPGPDAEGFRFDVCLRGKHGVVCAEETPAR